MLQSRLRMNIAKRTLAFIGPGCDFQVLVGGYAAPQRLGRRHTHQRQPPQGRIPALVGTLHEAIHYTNSTARRCCGIVLGAGIHRARARVTSPVTIEGAAPGCTIVAAYWTVASSFFSLKSVRVEPPGRSIKSPTIRSLLRIYVSRAHFRDCMFTASVARAVSRSSSTPVTPTETSRPDEASSLCREESCITGKKLTGSPFTGVMHIKSCDFSGCSGFAIRTMSSIEVCGTSFHECSGGIQCISGRFAPANLVEGASFKDISPRPAILIKSKHSEVKHCTMQRVKDAIVLLGASCSISDNSIASASTGISISGALDELGGQVLLKDSRVQDNRVQHTEIGIRLRLQESNVRVEGNVVESCSAAGLRSISEGSSSVLAIVGNRFCKPGRFGMELRGGAGFTISDNVVQNATSSGIEVVGIKRRWRNSEAEEAGAEHSDADGRGVALGGQHPEAEISEDDEAGIAFFAEDDAGSLMSDGSEDSGKGTGKGKGQGIAFRERYALACGVLTDAQRKRRQRRASARKAACKLAGGGPPRLAADSHFQALETSDLASSGEDAVNSVLNNEVVGNGRGIVIQDSPARIEGNVLARNNGWALHCDLRFSSSSCRSSIIGNRVTPIKSKSRAEVGNRTIRVSVPDEGDAVLPLAADNVIDDGGQLMPLMKRRRMSA